MESADERGHCLSGSHVFLEDQLRLIDLLRHSCMQTSHSQHLFHKNSLHDFTCTSPFVCFFPCFECLFGMLILSMTMNRALPVFLTSAFLAEPTWHCQGRTALHVAALNCHANVVKDLLAARAVQAVDCHGESLKSHTNTCQEALLETRRIDVNVRVKLHNSRAQGGL